MRIPQIQVNQLQNNHPKFAARYVFPIKEGIKITVIMSPPDRVGRHIVFPVRLSVCLSVCPSQIVSAL